MTEYIELESLTYPVTEQQIRSMFPNTSFPVVFDPPEGFAEVIETTPPYFNWVSERLVKVQPEQVNGVWKEVWEVQPLEQSIIDQNTQAQYTSKVNTVSARRYEKEISGVLFIDSQNNAFIISTERESQDKIANERLAVLTGMRTQPKSWKCYDVELEQVVFRQTTNDEIIEISTAVYNYVSACFAREEQLLAAINDGSYEDGMLSVGWP